MSSLKLLSGGHSAIHVHYRNEDFTVLAKFRTVGFMNASFCNVKRLIFYTIFCLFCSPGQKQISVL